MSATTVDETRRASWNDVDGVRDQPWWRRVRQAGLAMLAKRSG